MYYACTTIRGTKRMVITAYAQPRIYYSTKLCIVINATRLMIRMKSIDVLPSAIVASSEESVHMKDQFFATTAIDASKVKNVMKTTKEETFLSVNAHSDVWNVISCSTLRKLLNPKE